MIIANSYPAMHTRGIIVKYHELWEPLVTLSNMANWTHFLRGYVTLFTIFLKNLFLQHFNSENNGLVLFFMALSWLWNCFLSLVTTDDKDGHGLKLGKTGQLCKFCYVCKNHKEEMNCHCNRYASSFMLFWKSPLKKNLKPGSNVARNLMLMRQTLTQMSSHSFVSDSAHVKYIYHVWTGRKSICAPDKHCIYPYRHPSPAFLC